MICGLRTIFSDTTGAVVQGGATTLASVAGVLEGSAGRLVVDRTGLAGTYDVDLRFARSNLLTAAGAGVDLPNLFTALQERLGLKLESATGPVEFLVIDRIERPTPD
jgi:uncharacterized protein (TIGR03435 family)